MPPYCTFYQLPTSNSIVLREYSRAPARGLRAMLINHVVCSTELMTSNFVRVGILLRQDAVEGSGTCAVEDNMGVLS